MKPADALLLAAWDLAESGNDPFDVAMLTVAAWRRSPSTFGLTGFKTTYPDIRRVAAALAHPGRQNLLGRGDLKRYGTGQGTRYHLTPEGRVAAADLARALAAKHPPEAA